MASGVRRATADFGLGEFALRAFESVLLRAVSARLPACQFHSRSTHRAARRLDRIEGRRCEFVRHDFPGHDRDLRLTLQTGKSRPAYSAPGNRGSSAGRCSGAR